MPESLLLPPHPAQLLLHSRRLLPIKLHHLVPLLCGFQLGLASGRHWQMADGRWETGDERMWAISSVSGPVSAPWFWEGLLPPHPPPRSPLTHTQ